MSFEVPMPPGEGEAMADWLLLHNVHFLICYLLMFKKTFVLWGIFLLTSFTAYTQSDSTAELEAVIESEQEHSSSPGTLKIIDWNVWMGTDGKGYVKMGDLENATTRELRYKLQTAEFKKLDGDLVFLQEVSPIFKRSDQLARDLGMQAITQGDNCGIRIGNWGIPTNLQMGTAILAKPHLKLQPLKLEKESLTLGQLPGFGWGFCRPWGAFQLTERRVYVAGTIEWNGQPIWVINTHYTSGLGVCTENENRHCKMLDEWISTGYINMQQRVQIEDQLRKSDAKREQASAHLISLIPETQPVILGGDLNADPKSQAVQSFHKAKFQDISHTATPTWSTSQNPSIQEQVIRRKELLGRLTPLEELGLETDHIDQKIDYVLARSLPSSLQSASRTIFNQPVQTHWLSDHFGIEVVLTRRSDGE